MRPQAVFSFLTLAVAACGAPLAQRVLPEPVEGPLARKFLEDLIVAEDSNVPAYSRSYFKMWDTVSGKCNTREVVLIRDGFEVETNDACEAISGHWVSPYDNVVTSVAREFDIDHIVPLKEAWVSGARNWTPAQREGFANDIRLPQLVAVSAKANRSKGDKDVARWLPPNAEYVCTYVRAWVMVKHFYTLSIDQAEKEALTRLLALC